MALEYIDVSRKEQRTPRKKTPQHRQKIQQIQQIDISRTHHRSQRGQSTQRPVRRQPTARMTYEEQQLRRERIILRRKRRRMLLMIRMTFLAGIVLIAIGLGTFLYRWIMSQQGTKVMQQTIGNSVVSEESRHRVLKPNITEDFLAANPYSRPGESLPQVNNIFVHYTANKRTSAAQNRSYFENLGETKETSASAHFIIGYEGEIIQCLPLDEIAYAVVGRNYDSVSIECCYLEDDGEFTKETYDSLVWLCAWLLQEYDLASEDILRHYDEGGKKCPLYYVEHEEAWRQFIKDVENRML